VRKLALIILIPVGTAVLWLTLFSALAGNNRAFIIVNESDAALDDFSLQGDGFYYNRAQVAPHETFRVAFHTHPAVQIRITFNAMGQRYDVSRGARLWPIVHNRLKVSHRQADERFPFTHNAMMPMRRNDLTLRCSERLPAARPHYP
jgi:hypothetical protein